VSQKARHVRFQVTSQRGLEVVIPKRFDPTKVAALVAKNRQWIDRAIAKVLLLQESRIDPGPWQIPSKISFLAVDTEWTVVARETSARLISIRECENHQVSLSGPIHDLVHCRLALGRWLTRRAEIYLVSWLSRVSQETGLAYTGVTIKQQKTRWGSCSYRKTISLNARLLFLPPDAVHYILVHELCHTKHLNHSARFWHLVESYLPNFRETDKMLKKADQYLPAWLSEAGKK
jgi:predicted metal-dependent hydrolase